MTDNKNEEEQGEKLESEIILEDFMDMPLSSSQDEVNLPLSERIEGLKEKLGQLEEEYGEVGAYKEYGEILRGTLETCDKLAQQVAAVSEEGSLLQIQMGDDSVGYYLDRKMAERNHFNYHQLKISNNAVTRHLLTRVLCVPKKEGFFGSCYYIPGHTECWLPDGDYTVTATYKKRKVSQEVSIKGNTRMYLKVKKEPKDPGIKRRNLILGISAAGVLASIYPITRYFINKKEEEKAEIERKAEEERQRKITEERTRIGKIENDLVKGMGLESEKLVLDAWQRLPPGAKYDYAVGDYYWRMNDLDEAEHFYDKGLERSSNHPDWMIGRYSLAMVTLAESIDIEETKWSYETD